MILIILLWEAHDDFLDILGFYDLKNRFFTKLTLIKHQIKLLRIKCYTNNVWLIQVRGSSLDSKVTTQ